MSRSTVITIKEKYGTDFYKKIGAIGGGSNKGNWGKRGFATMDPKRHQNISAEGGSISKRTKGTRGKS